MERYVNVNSQDYDNNLLGKELIELIQRDFPHVLTRDTHATVFVRGADAWIDLYARPQDSLNPYPDGSIRIRHNGKTWVLTVTSVYSKGSDAPTYGMYCRAHNAGQLIAQWEKLLPLFDRAVQALRDRHAKIT